MAVQRDRKAAATVGAQCDSQGNYWGDFRGNFSGGSTVDATADSTVDSTADSTIDATVDSRGPGADDGVSLVEVEVAAWPPLDSFTNSEWEVGLSAGVTRRANSARRLTPLTSAQPLDLTVVEKAFSLAGLAPTIRVGADAWQPSHIAELENLGYTRTMSTTVMTTVLAPMSSSETRSEPCSLSGGASGSELNSEITPAARERHSVQLFDGPSDEWFAAYCQFSGYGINETRREIMTGCEALYALVTQSNVPVAVARAALVGAGGSGFAVHNCVAVAPAKRRQGWGRAMMRAQHEAVGRLGFAQQLLQVESENSIALELYHSMGYKRQYEYHYYSKVASGKS